jgi:hypothetical protein
MFQFHLHPEMNGWSWIFTTPLHPAFSFYALFYRGMPSFTTFEASTFSKLEGGGQRNEL